MMPPLNKKATAWNHNTTKLNKINTIMQLVNDNK
jgi:hypothetical protein